MLVQDWRFEVPAAGLALTEQGLMHSDFRITLKTRRGLVLDNALDRSRVRQVGNERSYLVVQLNGAFRLQSGLGAHELRPGQIACTRRNTVEGGRWEEGDQRALFIEWRAGGVLGTRLLPELETGALSPGGFRHLRAHALQLEQALTPSRATGGSERRCAAAAGILSVLRAEGIPFEQQDPGGLREQSPGALAVVNDAVGDILSSLGKGPAVVDLEAKLGWSRNWIHRNLSELQSRYYLQSTGGWRPLFRSWRLTMAVALMSSPLIRTEEAASIVGYGSARALCNAFANAGLPSPGAIRSELRRIA